MTFKRTCTLIFTLTSLVALSFGCAHPKTTLDATPSEANAPINSATATDASQNAFVVNPLRWKLVSDQNGIRVYKDQQASPGRIGLRGKTTINASIEKVATALTEISTRKRWLEGLVENRVVRTISDYERIEYGKVRARWPYQYTDFVYKMTFSVLREPRTLLIRMSGASDPGLPVASDTARGEVTNSANFVRQIDANHAELVIEMGIDPKGALPSWDEKANVVQWFDGTMVALKNVVEEPKFKVSERVQNYIKAHKL